MSKQHRLFLIYSIASIFFLCIPILSSPDFNYSLQLFRVAPFQRNFLSYVFLMGFFYVNYLYFIPAYYLSDKKIAYAIIILGMFSIISFLPGILIPGAPMAPMGDRPPQGPPPGMLFSDNYIPQFLFIFMLSFLSRINQQLNNIQMQKLHAEVSYLKAQINPHFLFNTLNSLYALTLEKSDEAPGAVLKLSAIMRYLVTESSRDYVPFAKEIAYLKDYIAMQLLRAGDNLTFSLDIKGETNDKQIAPLLLLPFIENAFKYGLSPEEKSEISIFIHSTEQQLFLRVRNTIVEVALTEEEKSETGIENTQKRLDLIYPGKHKLDIAQTKKNYLVELQIDLE